MGQYECLLPLFPALKRCSCKALVQLHTSACRHSAHLSYGSSLNKVKQLAGVRKDSSNMCHSVLLILITVELRGKLDRVGGVLFGSTWSSICSEFVASDQYCMDSVSKRSE